MVRTLVLGLDGATLDVLRPMVDRGVMPNIAELIQSGASGPLDSTMPPVTGPAWLSLASGRSPGQTGRFDFIQNDPDSDGFDFRWMEGGNYKGISVWDFLSESDVESGVIDYPMLSPPYPIDGFMICGGLGSSGHRCYPESIESDLSDFAKPTGHLNLRANKYDDLETFYANITENFERRKNIILHALGEYDWEFSWVVVQETDWFQHLMWKCFDDDHFEAASVSERERQMFRNFWSMIDEFIGDCQEIVADDTNLMIQSDHGFGPKRDYSFRLNTWLKKEGYLVPKSASGTRWVVKKSMRRLLSRIASSVRLEELAPSVFRWGRNKTQDWAIQFGTIDIDETTIFDPGHIGSMGGLYVNNDALGPDDDIESICKEVSEKLSAYAEHHDIDLQVYRPEQYYGNKPPESPDLIVRIPGWQIEDGGWDQPIIGDRPERLEHQNGSHRVEGVLIASGPDFDSGEINDARVWDIAPTILHLYGLPIPDEMDGRGLEEILLTDRNIEYAGEYQIGTESLVDESDEEETKQQLRDLGYFE